MSKYILQFDNGGGLTMQLGDDFVHHYDDMAHAYNDLSAHLSGETTAGWDGNEIDIIGAVEVNDNWERNGGTRTFDCEMPSSDDEDWGLNIAEFMRAAKK